MGWILLLFTAVPIVEMYLLITVGGYIGALPTIGCVMLTAVVGVTLLRWQGLATLTRGMQRAGSGELPGQEIVEGMLLAVAGALLLTPGFVTDGIGFLLLMPPVRAAIVRLLKSRVTLVQAGGPGGPSGMGPGPRPGGPGHGGDGGNAEGPVTLDGEYERR